jgi:hypothetical protein
MMKSIWKHGPLFVGQKMKLMGRPVHFGIQNGDLFVWTEVDPEWALLPNTEEALAANDWLESFFRFNGDYMPNSNEIHLDPTDRVTIHSEYVETMKALGQKALSITKFLFIWNNCYPNV